MTSRLAALVVALVACLVAPSIAGASQAESSPPFEPALGVSARET
jgi:hypothetical protein